MHTLVPVWILGGPFIGLLILAYSFKGPSAMGGTAPRLPKRKIEGYDGAAPLTDPIAPGAPRRFV